MDKINELLDAFTYEEIKNVLIKANSTSWLCGGNDKNWKADFDWLINIDNFVKVQDGRYDDLKPVNKGNNAQKKEDKLYDTDYDFEALEKQYGLR